MSKVFTLEEIESIVDLKEGEDPTTNVEQALNVATRLKILKNYAQNGNQYQLRWTSADPPISAPRGSVCSMICERLIAEFGNPDMVGDPSANGKGDPDDVPEPTAVPDAPPKPNQPKEPNPEETEPEIIPAVAIVDQDQDQASSMHEADGIAGVVGANVDVDSTVEEIAENMARDYTEEEIEAAINDGHIDPAVAEALASRLIPDDALEVLAASEASDNPGPSAEDQGTAEAKEISDIG